MSCLPFYKHFSILFFFLFALVNHVTAQINDETVCEDNKCPSGIFDIELAEPHQPAAYTTERTERFKQAYLTFLAIKSTAEQQPDWQANYNASSLTGKSCLRFYQLESTFGHEYFNNSAFKQFVDEQGRGSNIINVGFEGCRRGINLEFRMKRSCPSELKEAERKDGPRLEDMLLEYRSLGQELGYFDEEGNILKPLEIFPSEEKEEPVVAEENLNKRERIKRMKQQVEQLPDAPAVQEQITALNKDYAAAAPKLEELQQFSQKDRPSIDGLAETQKDLTKVTDDIDVLADSKLKFPKEELDGQIKSLTKQSEDLQKEAKELAGQEEELQQEFEDIVQRVGTANEEINAQNEAITKAQNRLDELAAEKTRLAAQLEDKPRRIIDELTKQVNDAIEEEQTLSEELAEAEKAKKNITEELDELTDEQKALEKRLSDTAQKAEALEEDQEELAKATQRAKDDMAAAQAKEAELDIAAKALAELPSEKELNDKIQSCADELQSIYTNVPQNSNDAGDLNDRMQSVQKKYQLLQSNALEIKTVQNKIPSVNLSDRTQASIDKLEARHQTLDQGLGLLQERITLLKQTVELSQGNGENKSALYKQQQADLEDLTGQLGRLFRQRVRLQNAIEIGDGDIDDLISDSDALVNDFRDFQAKINCSDVDKLQESLVETSKDRQGLEEKIAQLEDDLNLAEGQALELRTATDKLAAEATEESEHLEELAQEEELLQESLGEDLHLQAVKPEQWSEGFNVEREYWDAVFHPDDEVVEGYRGRYFEIKLRDAEKNVRMLFKPGEYYMDRTDFRDNYGSVISAFVTEALNGLSRLEREQIRLFVQGSADMSGQNTFSGSLDGRFRYTEVTVLPYKDNSDDFKPMPIDVEIPETGFTNNDLPNLRGNFLREMIALYSKKLQPVLLEGRVTDEVNEDDRNAIIYLFIPEELVKKYERS